MTEANACGSCRMCCNLLAVAELAKPVGKMCQHACPSGCDIYALRPADCAKYVCIWRDLNDKAPDGLRLDERFRPDNLGIVFDTLVQQDGCVMARLHPHRREALETPAAKLFIALLLRTCDFIIVAYGNKREILTKDPKLLRDEFVTNEPDGSSFKMKPRLIRI